MKILLACSAGMSTSMIVEKMKKAAREMGEDHQIWAVDCESIKNEIGKCDVILLGPQIRLEKKNIKKIAKGTPVEVIRPMDYGRQNGKAILEFAKSLVKEEGEN